MVVTTAPRRSIAADPPRSPAILLPDIGLERLPPAEGPKRGPELEVPPAPKPAPPGPGGGASALKFTLKEVLVEGATVFSDADLATSYQSLLGTAVSLADVQRVARTIESRYRTQGFFLSRAIVPVQTITDGRVRIRVLEGGVDDIRIEGDVGPVEALIDDYLRPVAAEKPLRLATLERALLLCNDIPGLTVSGSLRPSAEQVGSADLVVAAVRRPFQAAMVVDNFGDDFTGRREGAFTVLSNSWTQLGEQIAVTGFATEPWSSNNQSVGQIATSWRPGLGGLTLETIFSYGDSNPGGSVEDFNFDGKTLLAGGAIGYPLVRARAYTLDLRTGFEYVEDETDVFGGDEFSHDKLSILSFGLNGSFRDGLRGDTIVETSVRQGLPVLDATRRQDELKSRPDGTGQATTLRGAVARLQPLIGTLSLYLSGAGQYAFAPLLSYEQFDLGGTAFGRGYDFNAITGDSGIGGTSELRYDIPVQVPVLNRVQLFAFVEGGRVWSRDDLTDDSLSSTGGGFRLFPIGQTSIEVQVAKPLTLKSDRVNDTRDPQLLFRAVTRL